MSLRSRILVMTIGASLMLLGFVVGLRFESAGSRHPVAKTAFNRLTAVESKTEVVVFFLVSSFCGASQDEQLKLAMREDRARLAAEAEARGEVVRFVGVAIDGSFDTGIRLLDQFGSFDQLILGSGWINEAMVRLAWRDNPGPASLPQVVVLRRSVSTAESHIDVGADTVLFRKIGNARIRDWLRDPATRF